MRCFVLNMWIERICWIALTSLRSHRRTDTVEVSLLLRSHIPCVSKPSQNKFLSESLRTLHLFTQKTMHHVSFSSSCSRPKRETVSKVKKHSAILKRAMTEMHAGWSRKDWNSKSKHQWRSSGCRTELAWRMEEPETSSKMEGDVPRDGCFGVSLEKKRRTPGIRVAKKASKEKQNYTRWMKSS